MFIASWSSCFLTSQVCLHGEKWSENCHCQSSKAMERFTDSYITVTVTGSSCWSDSAVGVRACALAIDMPSCLGPCMKWAELLCWCSFVDKDRKLTLHDLELTSQQTLTSFAPAIFPPCQSLYTHNTIMSIRVGRTTRYHPSHNGSICPIDIVSLWGKKATLVMPWPVTSVW